ASETRNNDHAMDESEDTVDYMERRARIMELAQQQQIALQRLDELVENQRNVQANYYPRSADQDNVPAELGGRPLDDEGGISLVDDMREHFRDHDTGQRPRRRNQLMNWQYGAHSYSCSLTSMYFTLSAFTAILSLVTTPSNVLFPSTVMRVTPLSPPTKATSVGEVHQKNFALDGRVDIDDMGLKRSDIWDAVVAHSQAKRSSSTESSKWRSESKYAPPSSTSWTGSFFNILGEGKDRFIGRPQDTIEQYILLQELKFRTVLAHFLLSEIPTTSENSASTETEIDKPTSQKKWAFPWEWIKKKSVNRIAVFDGRLEQSVQIGNNVTTQSLLSSILGAMNLSFLEPTKEDDDTTYIPNTASRIISPPFMTIVDKIFSSTPRLIAIANLLIAFTFLLQTAVADFFLGNCITPNPVGNIPDVANSRTPRQSFPDEFSRRRRAGRERFVGFLLFKLLLISVVYELDSVDLFVFLSWYTLLAFLKSLSHLAGNVAHHASQSGEPPRPGVLHLLVLVLACNVSAAVGCVAIFHDWNMLLLLTFDCIVLGIDVVIHLMRYAFSTAEEVHRIKILSLEERQLELLAQRGVQTVGSNYATGSSRGMEMEGDEHESRPLVDDYISLDNELRQIDGAIQMDESAYGQRIASIDTAIFAFEMIALCLTIAHFLHVWSLHGTAGLSLVDGVLALHLHSTISLLGNKISERRNMHRVTREINKSFSDACDLDIRKASAAGDVCCICLNTLMVGGVKTIACGHLFHTNCLREVLERERSFASAKCPLCRASVVTGRHDLPLVQHVGAVGAGVENRRAQPVQQANQQVNIEEQSLLRFSTEHLFPSWLPIPAFAFEVVRRESQVIVEPNLNPEAGWQRFFRRGGQVQDDDVNVEGNNQLQPHEEQEPSFWRRVLILVGAIPMSPEEEAIALEQLVDMFPQYERADLLRELRSRRSAEAVAESILLGIFSGIPRGSG
ncbi:hypothetical protein ACHAXA_006093, partial [Cyclostephanos tholiformis]